MQSLVPTKKYGGRLNGITNSSSPVSQFRWGVDHLLDQFLDGAWPGNQAPTSKAGIQLEILEDDEQVLVLAEVPGVDPEAMEIQLTGDALTISGEKQDLGADSGQRRYSERWYGSFRRVVQLPCPIDAEAVEAQHRHGILTIRLRKADAVRPKRIEVNAS